MQFLALAVFIFVLIVEFLEREAQNSRPLVVVLQDLGVQRPYGEASKRLPVKKASVLFTCTNLIFDSFSF